MRWASIWYNLFNKRERVSKERIWFTKLGPVFCYVCLVANRCWVLSREFQKKGYDSRSLVRLFVMYVFRFWNSLDKRFGSEIRLWTFLYYHLFIYTARSVFVCLHIFECEDEESRGIYVKRFIRKRNVHIMFFLLRPRIAERRDLAEKMLSTEILKLTRIDVILSSWNRTFELHIRFLYEMSVNMI